MGSAGIGVLGVGVADTGVMGVGAADLGDGSISPEDPDFNSSEVFLPRGA